MLQAAPAVSLPLTQLLAEVPELLTYISPETLKALHTTSSSLRSIVWEAVLLTVQSISLWPAPKHISQLVAIDWPCLVKVSFQAPVTATAMALFSSGNWTNLRSLDFQGFGLHSACLRQLTASHLPALQDLNLSGTDLPGERMALLQHAHWPQLKAVWLRKCKLDYSSMTYFTAACWPKLDRIDLRGSLAFPIHLIQLAKGNWPELEHLTLPTVPGRLWDYPNDWDNVSQSFDEANWPKVQGLTAFL